MAWIPRFFVEKGGLFRIVLESMVEGGVEEARDLAGFLEAHGVPRGSRVLDLGCGIGRIAVPLAVEGYHVTCLDISPILLDYARDYAERMGVGERVEIVQGDAWHLDQLVGGEHDAVILYWTTLLGYHVSPEKDVELLSKAHKATTPKGKLFILRQAHRDLLIVTLARCRERKTINELDGHVLVETPKFDPITGILENTWTYYKKTDKGLDLLGEETFRIRVYTPSEIVDLASRAGWRLLAVYGSLEMDPFDSTKKGFNGVFEKY